MANWNGQLRSNEVFASIYNMIISIQVYADNIAGTYGALAQRFKKDGTLYGDTKLYYDTDVLESKPWGADAEATNLLALHRPKDPITQAISLTVFRQISLTLDNYLSKRAYKDEGTFSQFNSVMLGWISDTKKIYSSTLMNSYIGTTETAIGKQTQSITLPVQYIDADQTEVNLESTARLEAETIAQKIADIFTELKDISRDYNDNGTLKSYDTNDLLVVWNSEFINKITKYDLPTMFHKDGLIDKFGQEILPARYFGTVNATSGTTTASNSTIRSLYETDYVVSSTTYHVFPGDLLPGSASYEANMTYTEDNTVICKIMRDNLSVPFMSAFEVGTSFFNPKSLTENHYFTWGHNPLQYLKRYPFITLRANSQI